MILTNDRKIFLKCSSLKNLSFTKSYYERFKHDDIGWNIDLQICKQQLVADS